MSHDPLCQDFMEALDLHPNCGPECASATDIREELTELIAMVREDERNKLLPAHWSQDWHLGYRQGVADTEKKFRDER